MKKGTPLLELSAWDGLGPSLTVQAQLLSEIQGRRDALEWQKGLAWQNYSADREALTQSIEAAHEELKSLSGEVELEVFRRDLVDRRFSEAKELLDFGVIAKNDLSRLEDELRSRQLEESEKRRLANSTRNSIRAQTIRLDQIKVERDVRLAALEAQIYVLSAEEVRVMGEGGAQVLAPRDGLIASILVQVGDAVQASDRLLDIVPEDASLLAELIVGSGSLGFLEPDQEVRVYLDAFPYEQHGSQTGRIVKVSPTPIEPYEAQMTGVPLTTPMFRVTVDFPHGLRVPGGGVSALKPGAALSADLIRDRSTLFEWLLEPLKGTGERI